MSGVFKRLGGLSIRSYRSSVSVVPLLRYSDEWRKMVPRYLKIEFWHCMIEARDQAGGSREMLKRRVGYLGSLLGGPNSFNLPFGRSMRRATGVRWWHRMSWLDPCWALEYRNSRFYLVQRRHRLEIRCDSGVSPAVAADFVNALYVALFWPSVCRGREGRETCSTERGSGSIAERGSGAV